MQPDILQECSDKDQHYADIREYHVTVSIPYFDCITTLRQAVESILEQTHKELTLIVVNDGDKPPWKVLQDIDDPRLICFDMVINRGRYFADAVVLNATDSSYFLIQDADDWSEPNRIALLLRHMHAEHSLGTVSSIKVDHQLTPDQSTIERFVTLNRPLPKTLKHRAPHFALFKTEALRAIGGYFGGFRVGYDTLIVNLLQMIGRLGYIDRPLYHRLIRPDSLINASATGMKSEFRRKTRKCLRNMYAEAFISYSRYLHGDIRREQLVEKIRLICTRTITLDDKIALEKESQRLRKVIKDHETPV